MCKKITPSIIQNLEELCKKFSNFLLCRLVIILYGFMYMYTLGVCACR